MITNISGILRGRITPRWHRRTVIRVSGYVGIILLALFLRLWNLGFESAWIDEAYSIILAHHNLFDIVRGTAADQHPPLYYLLLHFWLKVDSSILFARLLSAFIGVLQIAVIIKIGETIANLKFGLIAGLIMAILPLHVWYSQEARMYILIALLTSLATLELFKIQDTKSNWIRYVAWLTLSFYTHYFTFFIVLAHAIYALLHDLFRREEKIFIRIASAQIVSLGFFSVWLPRVYFQARNHTMPWIEVPTFESLRDVILRIFFGDQVLQQFAHFLWPLFVLILSFILIGCVFSVHHRGIRKNQIVLTLIWAFVPLLAIYLISQSYPIYQYKQHLIIAAPLILCFVIASWALPKQFWTVPILLAVMLQLNSLWIQQTTLTKDDWESMASFLDNNIREQDAIIANPAAAKLPLSLYTKIESPFIGYPLDYSILTGGWKGKIIDETIAIKVMQNLPENTERVWLIEYFPSLWDPGSAIEKNLRSRGDFVFAHPFGNIQLRLYGLDLDE